MSVPTSGADMWCAGTTDAPTNWIRFGHAQRLADAGFEAIMPDLRAHGQSAAPHDPAGYPEDVLVKDAQARVGHLGLSNYDLGGFSLGAQRDARNTPASLVLPMFWLVFRVRPSSLTVASNRSLPPMSKRRVMSSSSPSMRKLGSKLKGVKSCALFGHA